MAGEVTISGGFTYNKNGVAESVSGTKTTNVATTLVGIPMRTIQVVGTSATFERVVTGADMNIATECILCMRNLDATNFVSLSLTTSSANVFAIMRAGETHGPVRYAANCLPYLQANAANVNVDVCVGEVGDPAL